MVYVPIRLVIFSSMLLLCIQVIVATMIAFMCLYWQDKHPSGITALVQHTVDAYIVLTIQIASS